MNQPKHDQPQEISWEIQDAAETFARKTGRHAKVFWHPILRCAVIEFSAHPDDPRYRAWQEGKLKFEPKELVVLHRQTSPGSPYVAINLAEMGASGLAHLLEEADVWSGRGEHGSLNDSFAKVDAANEAARQNQINAVEEAARESAWLHRRSVLGVPFVSVPSTPS